VIFLKDMIIDQGDIAIKMIVSTLVEEKSLNKASIDDKNDSIIKRGWFLIFKVVKIVSIF
jgi:hypothetical protein